MLKLLKNQKFCCIIKSYNKNVGKRIDGGCFQHYPRGGVCMEELDKILTIIIIALLIELLRNIKK